MNRILDQVAAAEPSRVRPRTGPEFLALRLTQKLDDVQDTQRYMSLADEQPLDRLLVAYRRAASSARSAADRRNRFHVELNRLKRSERTGEGNRATLLALKV